MAFGTIGGGFTGAMLGLGARGRKPVKKRGSGVGVPFWEQQYVGLLNSDPTAGIDFADLRRQAQEAAFDWANPMMTLVHLERDKLAGRKKVSQEAAANFAAALAQIFTGGKPGEEGEKYALETYGSSYSGALAADEGRRMIEAIGRDFDEKDWELAGKLSEIWNQMPEEAEKVYQDLVKNTSDILNESYDKRLAAAALMMKREWQVEDKNRDYLFKLTQGRLKGGGADGQVIYGPNNSSYWLDKKTGKVTPIVQGQEDPTVPKTVTLADGRKAYVDAETGNLIPYGGENPARATRGKTSKKRRPDLRTHYGAIYKAARTLEGPSEGNVFPGSGVLKGKMPWDSAWNELWNEFGVELVGEGYNPSRVRALIARALVAAGYKKPKKDKPPTKTTPLIPTNPVPPGTIPPPGTWG